jgi:hypothetical protein
MLLSFTFFNHSSCFPSSLAYPVASSYNKYATYYKDFHTIFKGGQWGVVDGFLLQGTKYIQRENLQKLNKDASGRTC